MLDTTNVSLGVSRNYPNQDMNKNGRKHFRLDLTQHSAAQMVCS